jgi:hypothetical protein
MRKRPASHQRRSLPPQFRRLRFEPLEDRCLLSITYDLQTDWSDAANPNGVWAYREGNNNLPHVNSWQSTLGGWSTAQPAWSRSENGGNRLPVIFRSNGSETFAHDWIAGDVIVHSWDSSNGIGNGLANIVWTSPGAGTIDITGSTWAGRDIGRSNQWNLYVNNSLVTSGSVASGDPYSRANPFNFAAGSGGAGVLDDVAVSAGDTVRFNVTATSPAGDFVGVNLQVEFTAASSNSPPEVIVFGLQQVNEGQLLDLSGSGGPSMGLIIDSDSGDTHTAAVNWGDGPPNQFDMLTVFPFNGVGKPIGGPNARHAYADGNAPFTDYSVRVRVADNNMSGDFVNGTDGVDFVQATFTVRVFNVAPQLTDPTDVTIQENGIATLVTTVTDPGMLDVFSVDVNWQDGTSNRITALGAANSSGTIGGTTFVWTAATRQLSVSHQYLDDDPSVTGQDDYNVALMASDDDLGTGTTQTATITVQNVAPQISDPANVTIQEGGTATLVTTVTDPGTLDVFTVDINWQDGTSNTITALGLANSSGTVDGTTFVWTAATRQLNVSHQYLDDGPSPGNGTNQENYNVTITVSDDDLGTGATQTAQVTVQNVAPELSDPANVTIQERGIATLVTIITDPGTLDVFSIDVNWQDGSSNTLSGLGLSNASGTVGGTSYVWTASTRQLFVSHQYLDDDPSGTSQDAYNVTLIVNDDDLGTGVTQTAIVTVQNAAPTVTLNAVPTISQNGTASLTGSYTDIGLVDSHTLTIDWDDPSNATDSLFTIPAIRDAAGNPTLNPGNTFNSANGAVLTITAVNDATGQVSFSAQHQYHGLPPGSSNPRTISVTAADDDGQSGAATTNVQLIPPPPLVGDYNLDNVVDAADYIVWRKTLGNSVAIYTGADGSGDGIVGPEDHNVWRANFGRTYSTVANGLLGYWKFDGNGGDSSGSANTLNLFGGIGFAGGLFGQALDLHANTSQYAIRPVDDPEFKFGSNDFTIQVWVNFNTTAGEQVLIEKFTSSGGPGWTFTEVATNRMQFYASPSGTITTSPVLTANQWHQILIQREDSAFRLWYDGQVIGTATNANPIPSSTNGLLIGKRNPADGRGFPVNGRLDEIAIWDRNLTSSEIQFLWNSGAGYTIEVAGGTGAEFESLDVGEAMSLAEPMAADRKVQAFVSVGTSVRTYIDSRPNRTTFTQTLARPGSLQVSQRERGFTDHALVAWLRSRDAQRVEDPGDSRAEPGDRHDFPSYENVIDDAFEKLAYAFETRIGGFSMRVESAGK